MLSKEQAFESLSRATMAFVGVIEQVTPGISTRSMPPIQHYQIKFKNIQPLRGSQFGTEQFHYQQHGAGLMGRAPVPIIQGIAQAGSANEFQQVKYPTEGVQYLACLQSESNIDVLVELDPEMMNQLIHSAKLPLGWQKESNGNLVSPWQASTVKQASWCQQTNYNSVEKCSKTGRPMLLANQNITFTCEPVHTSEVNEFKNPNGDGVFKLTVVNNTNNDIEVPALLRDSQSKTILWEDSIFVRTSAGNHFFPGQGQAKQVEPTVLKPQQTVSIKLDTLTLRDLQWPQGGWRLKLQFCLGDQGADGSFYYFTDHHDPIRQAAERKTTAIVA